MEPYRDDDLTAALSTLRPEPRPAFAAELDARVAAGFPRKSRLGEFSPLETFDRLRALKPRQVLLPAGAFALTAIVVATVVVAQGSSSSSDSGELSLGKPDSARLSEEAAAPQRAGTASGVGQPSEVDQSSGAGEAEAEYETEATELPSGASGAADAGAAAGGAADRNPGFAAGRSQRAVERSAEITLGTDPAGVGDAAAKVFDTVHAYRGVVLSSSIDDGATDSASAEFELLIPSGKLGDAMAAFSGIAEVRSRHEATDDITAPTVSATERLQDSQARIDSLLAQLAAAETEGEREAVEAELATERRRAAGLRADLQNLDRRANLSRVELRIESGEEGAAPDAGGSWGIGDALGDAGRILAVGAAVSLVGLAIVGPIALIALFAWLAHRAWLRRARRHALG